MRRAQGDEGTDRGPARRALRSAAGALLALAALLALLAGCGGDGAGRGSGERPSIVVTTSILGDVVRSMVGDRAAVTTIMPAGADPHGFGASARQAAEMREADALIVNGGGFEGGLDDVVEGARGDGVAVFAALDAVPRLPFGHPGDEGAEEGAVDPHFFTDPARMAVAAGAIGSFLAATVPALGDDAFRQRVDAAVADLEALDAEAEATLAPIPPAGRVLVTNHDVFGYFADRYGFRIVGTVIPSGSTTGAASAAELAQLAEAVRDSGVRAVFGDASAPHDLADALAAEVGADVAVVELFSESLGGPGSGAATYAELVRTNASRIADALSVR